MYIHRLEAARVQAAEQLLDLRKRLESELVDKLDMGSNNSSPKHSILANLFQPTSSLSIQESLPPVTQETMSTSSHAGDDSRLDEQRSLRLSDLSDTAEDAETEQFFGAKDEISSWDGLHGRESPASPDSWNDTEPQRIHARLPCALPYSKSPRAPMSILHRPKSLFPSDIKQTPSVHQPPRVSHRPLPSSPGLPHPITKDGMMMKSQQSNTCLTDALADDLDRSLVDLEANIRRFLRMDLSSSSNGRE